MRPLQTAGWGCKSGTQRRGRRGLSGSVITPDVFLSSPGCRQGCQLGARRAHWSLEQNLREHDCGVCKGEGGWRGWGAPRRSAAETEGCAAAETWDQDPAAGAQPHESRRDPASHPCQRLADHIRGSRGQRSPQMGCEYGPCPHGSRTRSPGKEGR